MVILYIEDEQHKAKDLINFIESYKEHKIIWKKSYINGLIELEENRYDLILLDMSLPLYDADFDLEGLNEFDPLAGIHFLDEMKRVGYTEKVIVITAYDYIKKDETQSISLENLKKEMQNQYPENYVDGIFYSDDSLEWQNTLNLYL
ncbi:MAG: response regulator [Lachnospiraceae bacterium]|nr:response regulator [Lachnospiraceae bacterium]